jgi:TRAP transporter 4TM/12TM fusion protein
MEKWKFENIVGAAFSLAGVAMCLYQLASTQYVLLSYWAHQNAHLGFALLLIFLAALKEGAKKNKPHILASVSLFLILSLACTGYVAVLIKELEMRALFNTPVDLVVGVVLILIVFMATWRSFGSVLPAIAAFFVIYAFIGQYAPGSLKTMVVSPSRLIGQLSIGLSGIYGDFLSISADDIFPFVLFGMLLQTSGATGFFEEIGKLTAGRLRAGPALSSVVTSALIGTCTGSIAANIATTGSFTIPAMKKAGYKPEYAGAIEAAASSGGQIMPPVMGAAAFVMAGITGIPYLRIMTAAIFPAILYFLVVGLYTQLRAAKLQLERQPVIALNVKEMLLRMPLFVIPLGIIVYLLILGHSLSFCAFWGTISCVVLSLFRKQTRGSFATWIDGLAKGALVGAQIAVAISTIGIVISVITLTGLGVKLPGLVDAWSGGNLTVALLIVMGGSIILGMGTSTVAVYLLVAIVAAPVVVKLGVPLLAAHFFVFFYACFSFLTPPVAVGALIASKLAGGTYMKTSIEAVKASVAGFLLPFIIVWNPILLLLENHTPFFEMLLRLGASILAILAVQFVSVDYYVRNLHLVERISLAISASAIITYFITGITVLLAIGTGIFLFVSILQLNAFRRKV